MNFPRTYLSFAVLSILSASTYANSDNDLVNTVTNKTSVQLSPLVVTAEEDKQEVGKTIYKKEDLEPPPNSSKNITDFLKVNPNVQFGQSQLSAGSQGEIKPSEISINGAQTFQNNFIVNGVSNNLLINPANPNTNTFQDIGTGAQAIAVNTDLLCELEVLDSNVSAAYGQFTGGVVNAKTCAPQTEIGKIHGSITYDYTDSDWARYNSISPLEDSKFEEPSDEYQKEYTKQGLSTNIYGKLSDNWGFNAYISQRESIIPVKSGFEEPKIIAQKRHNSNIGTTLFYTPNTSTKAKLGFDYGLLDSLSYVDSNRNSGSTTETETLSLFSELEHQFSFGTLVHKLNFQNSTTQRIADNNYSMHWHYAEGSKDWNNTDIVREGAIMGELEQNQDVLSYDLQANIYTLKFGQSQHNITLGAGYSHANVEWKRAEDVLLATKANLKKLDTFTCLSDDPYCDNTPTINGWNGQYIAGGTLYKAGDIKAKQDRLNIFIQDNIQWNNQISTRFGVRADYDSLSNNINIAPRSSFSYKPFNNDKLHLSAGWNRYYGQQTLGTELNEIQNDLFYKLSRQNPHSPWVETPTALSTGARSSDLNTPFSDEVVFGLNTQIHNWDLGLKWVNRKYQDEISKTKVTPLDGSKFFYEYSNDGSGKADIYTLSLKNREVMALAGSQHLFTLAFDYSDVFRSSVDYTSTYNQADQDELVSYGGQIIHWSERPASNFNQPWTARINWDITFDTFPVRISNFFSYKDSYDDMIAVTNKNDKVEYQGELLDTYLASEIKPKFTWDMRTTYDWKISKDLKAIFGLTVNNVTNRVNTYTTLSTTSTKPRVMTEIGRQFIADITFKF